MRLSIMSYPFKSRSLFYFVLYIIHLWRKWIALGICFRLLAVTLCLSLSSKCAFREEMMQRAIHLPSLFSATAYKEQATNRQHGHQSLGFHHLRWQVATANIRVTRSQQRCCIKARKHLLNVVSSTLSEAGYHVCWGSKSQRDETGRC